MKYDQSALLHLNTFQTFPSLVGKVTLLSKVKAKDPIELITTQRLDQKLNEKKLSMMIIAEDEAYSQVIFISGVLGYLYKVKECSINVT